MNYIIDFKNHITIEEIEQFFQDNNIVKLKDHSFFDRVYLVSSSVPITINDYIEKVIEDTHENKIQLLTEEITIVHPTSNLDSFSVNEDKDWWKVVTFDGVDFDQETHQYERFGTNSVVYVLDSGIESTHSEFSNSKIELLYSHTGEFSDTNGHGTAIASVLVGTTCGVTNSSVKVVKIFDANNPTMLSHMLSALDEVALDYINNGKLPSVINCSWSIPKNTYVNDKIQQLIDLGLFVVASAGNSGIPIGDVTPASIPEVFTIGSFGQDLEPSNFSNYTDSSAISFTQQEVNHGQLDGWAPGEKIFTAGLGNTLVYVAGTSISAAIASGAIAYNIERYLDPLGDSYSGFNGYKEFQQTLENQAALVNNTSYGYNSLFRGLCLSKANILNLSDPKYNSSDNLIVAYKSQSLKYEIERNLVVLTSNTQGSVPLYSNKLVTKLILQESLPSYASIDARGWLIYTTPTITEPYLVTRTPITIEYSDGSTFNTLLVCVVFKEGINYSNMNELVPDDELIIKLQSTSCIVSGYCFYDDCGSFSAPPCGGSADPKGYGCSCSSDRDIKNNILYLGTYSGINLYSFEYKSQPDKTYKGTMAQELLNTTYEKAVSKVGSTYVVDYSVLPKDFLKHCELI